MEDIEQKLAELKTKFLALGLQRADALEAALAAGDRDEVKAIAHGISGTAGMFGLTDIGRSAARLEAIIFEGGDPQDQAQSLVAALRQLGDS
jgi:HPt (histidine-containing phosphotransfer) domain-containing protein